MIAEPDHDPAPQPFAAAAPARRNGSIVLVLLVAFAIVAVAVALMTIGRSQAQPYILGLLALLAMVGLFNLFAFAAGIIRFADPTAAAPVIARIAAPACDGTHLFAGTLEAHNANVAKFNASSCSKGN